MTASIRKMDDQVIAEFEREYPVEIDLVWRMLAENQYLQKWFADLEIQTLEEDGTFEEMTITSLSVPNVLEYTLGNDLVRFDVTPSKAGTHLIFKETISEVTDHTPKDITGWHICLDVIEAILSNEELPDRQLSYNEWYPVYEEKFTELTEEK